MDTFIVNPTAPKIDNAVLKRLGEAPFAIGGQNITSLLSKAYKAVDEVVLQELSEEDE